MARSRKLLLSEDLRKALGICLRNLRQSKRPGLSATKVAKELGVSAASLCDYENGKAEPSLAFIHIVAREFKVHPNVILGIVHIKEFDFAGILDGEAAGTFRLQDFLPLDTISTLRDELESLGYKRVCASDIDDDSATGVG